MILVSLLFAFLWYLQKRPRREGVLTLTFGLFYGCFRLLEDSFRIDKRFGPLTGSQWTALVVAVLSATILLWWRFHPLPPSADIGDDEAPIRTMPSLRLRTRPPTGCRVTASRRGGARSADLTGVSVRACSTWWNSDPR